MITDRVGDFIIRLKNAGAVEKLQVRVPYSAHLFAIAKKLKELGFVASVTSDAKDEGVKKTLIVTLAVDGRGAPRIRGVKRLSKPGRRLYRSHKEAHRVKGGLGARILSTPSGILSDREARNVRVGGEDLFEIW